MRRIGFLDLASTIGWAAGPADCDPQFGTQRLPNTQDDIGRFVDAYDVFLTDWIGFYELNYVGFEAPIHTGGKTSFNTARKLLALASHTEFVCRRRNVRCEEAHIGTIKKSFAGSGRAQKSDMEHIARRYGWAVRNDHEADALGGWVLAVTKLTPQHAGRFLAGPLGARPLKKVPA